MGRGAIPIVARRMVAVLLNSGKSGFISGKGFQWALLHTIDGSSNAANSGFENELGHGKEHQSPDENSAPSIPATEKEGAAGTAHYHFTRIYEPLLLGHTRSSNVPCDGMVAEYSPFLNLTS